MLEFVDYLGVLAIMITLIGAVVFFFVAVFTVQVNRESRDMRKKLDKLSSDVQDFKNLLDTNLDERREQRRELDDQRKDIQEIKDLVYRVKKPK